jgi:D-lactate dehydrogenase
MRIAMYSTKSYDQQFFTAANSHGLAFTFLVPRLDRQTAVLAGGHAAVCCFVNDTLDAAVLETLASQGVRLVALRCAGFNNVDLKAARTLGIAVCRVPEYSPYAVAEHTVALILDLNRNIHRAHNRVRENDYSLDGLLGFDLHGKTVGVIGAGRIGRVFVTIMRGFGCKVLVHDPFLTEALPEDVTSVSLDTLLRAADIVSLHCPLTPETRYLIAAESVAQMKRGVMLINTSRGALVDTRAVIAGLKSGHIGYLGLDVYEEEADLFFENLSNLPIQDDVFARLQTFPNVLITGHQAFFTREALTRIAQTTLQNLNAWRKGAHQDMHLVE